MLCALRGHRLNMNEAERHKDKSTAEMEKYLRYLKIQFQRSLREPEFILEILVFVILAVYTVFTGFMYFANRDAADAARDSAVTGREALTTVQRPFVTFPPSPSVVSVRDAKRQLRSWRFYLPIENSGDTPTKGLKAVFNFNGIQNAELSDFRDFGTANSFNLGPKAMLSSEGLDVSPETVKNIQTHKARLFFYGWACYRDQFKDTPVHITEFCYEVPFFKASPIPGSTDWRIVTSLSACTSHVCVDDECKAQDKPQDRACSER